MALKQPRSAFIVLRMHTIAEPKAEGFWPCDVGRRAAQEIDNCTYRSVVGCMMWGHLRRPPSGGKRQPSNRSLFRLPAWVCDCGCPGESLTAERVQGAHDAVAIAKTSNPSGSLRRGKAISNQSKRRQTAKSELTGAPQVVS